MDNPETAGKGHLSLQATIAGLRLCNAAQNKMISTFEEYQRKILGVGSEPDSIPAGYQGGYGAELDYLHSRREAIDSLIAAVERYNEVSEAIAIESDQEVEAG